jgi:hypothetical protein
LHRNRDWFNLKKVFLCFVFLGEGIKEDKKFRVKFVSETTSSNLFLQEAREFGKKRKLFMA